MTGNTTSAKGEWKRRRRSSDTLSGGAGPRDALRWLAEVFQRDRTQGQDVSVYLGVEKQGMVEQIEAWFGDLGMPILALGGYASQSYVTEIAADAAAQGRPAVLLYTGDF